MDAKQNIDTLWDRGSESAYRLLFEEQPGAPQIWGAVRLHRLAVSHTHEMSKGYRGRASELAERGDFLVSHLLFQMIGRRGTSDDDQDWDTELTHVPERVETAFPWLVHHTDALYGDSRSSFIRTLADSQRCREIVGKALEDIRSGRPTPPIPEGYRRGTAKGVRGSRRPNTVTILKNAGVLTEGTELRFEPRHSTEKEALNAWLAEAPDRARATWTGERRYSLLWWADEQRYSPSGLVMHMYELAGWENAPVSVQGPSRWRIDGTAMSDLAERIFTDLGTEE